jgi:hypothetical protein
MDKLAGFVPFIFFRRDVAFDFTFRYHFYHTAAAMRLILNW